MSAKALSMILRMIFCSIAVKYRPSALTYCTVWPPKKHSTKANTIGASMMKRDSPFSGFIRNRLMFEGRGSVFMKSPNFIIVMPWTLTSTNRRRIVVMELRKVLANRSFAISRPGIRPRMIRSWLRKLNSWVPSGAPASPSVPMSPVWTPFNRESISSWERISSVITASRSR